MHSTPILPSPASEYQSAAPPIITAAEAADVINGWTDLKPARRRDLISAVSRVVSWLNLPAGAVVLSGTFLNERLFKRQPQAFGVERKTFINVVSGIRCILRKLGSLAPRSHGRDSLSPAWQGLFDALAQQPSRHALSGFMQFCTLTQVAPTAVEPGTLADYVQWAATETLSRSANKRGQMVRGAWELARQTAPGWPDVALTAVRRRQTYTLPWSDYPLSLQQDLAVWRASLAPVSAEDLFPDDIFDSTPTLPHGRGRRPHAAKPRTLETRDFQLRQAAAALVQSGVDSASITALRDLVQPREHLRAILMFFFERAGRKPTTQTGGIAEILRQVAKYHCRLPEAEVAPITTWAKRVTPQPRQGMTDKNRARLRPLSDERNRAMLLHLPAELMRRATTLRPSAPKQAARMALHAVVLEILLICPLRIENVRGLRLDQHLQRLDPRGKAITHFAIPGDEVKNCEPIDWPVSRPSSTLIEDYMVHDRPHLATPANPYLLPGIGDGPRGKNTLFTDLTVTVAKMTGLEVNPHLMRHFAAWRYLKANPGAYETVRRILDHRSIETTIAYYTGLEAEFAAEHFDRQVLQDRSATKTLAAAAFKGRRKSTPHARRAA